jgi:DNA-binding transcriptional LysR family regulator
LEIWAGTALFERMSRSVGLTELGRQVNADFSVAFDLIGQASNRLRSGVGQKQIRIAVLPGNAQLWLSKRLSKARVLLPDINISITALDQAPNLLREPCDLSIFFR